MLYKRQRKIFMSEYVLIYKTQSIQRPRKFIAKHKKIYIEVIETCCQMNRRRIFVQENLDTDCDYFIVTYCTQRKIIFFILSA